MHTSQMDNQTRLLNIIKVHSSVKRKEESKKKDHYHPHMPQIKLMTLN